MSSPIINQAKTQMTQAIEHFKTELKSIRTGRAHTGLVDGVMVEVYGTPMRLKEIANMSTPEARQLLITPFDPKNTSVIGKAIEKANLGFMPIVDGNVVRIKIPPMDEAMRKEVVKVLHKKLEETKVGIRNHRQDANKQIDRQKSSGEMPEDQVNKNKKTIQELTDKFCKDAEDLAAAKEKEVMTV